MHGANVKGRRVFTARYELCIKYYAG